MIERYSKDFLLFIEAGMLAIEQGDEEGASKLFCCAKLLDASNPLAEIGMGYLHLCKLQLRRASNHFANALQQDPSSAMARAFQGITLALSREQFAEGTKILQQVEQSTSDQQIKQLAHDATSFVETFINKEPATR